MRTLRRIADAYGGRHRPRPGPEGAGSADAPLRRAQRQDLRSHPRHADQDRRPAGRAGYAEPDRTSRTSSMRAAPVMQRSPRRKLDDRRRCRSIDPDAADLRRAGAAASERLERSAGLRMDRTPAAPPAEAAVARRQGARPDAAADGDRPAARSRCSAALRARLQRQEATAPPMPAAAGRTPTPRHAEPKLDLDQPLDPQARQPAARARLRRARSQRDHEAGARRARPAGKGSEADAAKSDFIAAARRAAQAAAAEAEVLKRQFRP